MIRRRHGALRATALSLVLGVALAGCASGEQPQRWQGGRLVIGTGSTTGGFYQLGGGLADLINARLEGYEATTAPTAGSTDNLLRIASGDVNLAFTFADVAADAARGEGVFTGQAPRMRALARVYSSYTHLIVRNDSDITSFAGLRGRKVATGPRYSGTEFLALRLIGAAGLDPDKDVDRRVLSLPETTRAMLDGSIDAMFWTDGLPTVGITDLLARGRGSVRFLPVNALLPALDQRYPRTYAAAEIPADAYNLPAAVPTIAVVNLVVVAEQVPDDLAYRLVKLIFDYHHELIAVHQEWRNISRETAPRTEPVPLHPGAARFFRDG